MSAPTAPSSRPVDRNRVGLARAGLAGVALGPRAFDALDGPGWTAAPVG